MEIYETKIVNRLGLHARACAKLVELASRFTCDIAIVARGRRASARNVISVMLLAASLGTPVRLEADGPEESAAIREMAELIQGGFGEGS